jgi:Fe-S-cluster containining protein
MPHNTTRREALRGVMTAGKSENSGVWYEQGLHFHCTQCGECCTGTAGYVDFTPTELEAMARHLGLLPDEFLRRYARRRKGWWSLREVEVEGAYDCIFLKRDPRTGRGRCAIYEVRPSQCRTWPFWSENLESPRAWENAAKVCPGVGNGRGKKRAFFSVEQIRRCLEAEGG